MFAREALHQIVDELPETELSTAQRVLDALRMAADPVLRALTEAPADDEADDDDFDGGLTESRREADQDLGLSHEDVKRELGLA